MSKAEWNCSIQQGFWNCPLREFSSFLSPTLPISSACSGNTGSLCSFPEGCWIFMVLFVPHVSSLSFLCFGKSLWILPLSLQCSESWAVRRSCCVGEGFSFPLLLQPQVSMSSKGPGHWESLHTILSSLQPFSHHPGTPSKSPKLWHWDSLTNIWTNLNFEMSWFLNLYMSVSE